MSEFKTAYKRSISRQYLWLGLILMLALICEMTFDMAERVIGQYLTWQNQGRQKIGRSWEDEQQRIAAGVRLESVTRERRRQAMELESISNFEDLVQYVETNQQALLLPSQFLQIYRQLPEFFQPLLVDPDSLLEDAREQRLANVLANGNRSRFNVAILDPYDSIIRQNSLNELQMNMLINHGKECDLQVRNEARFAENLFNADDFFALLAELSADRRYRLLRELLLLTESAGQIEAVGISGRPIDDFTEIAFAVSDNRAYVYYLPENWILELLLADRRRAIDFYWKRR
jgi:hypothetical protein